MIKAVVVGDDRVKEWLKGRYYTIEDKVRQTRWRLVIKLVRNIKADKLSGQVLNTRTGTLRRSITPDVMESGTSITGQASTNVKYAARHEYGFHGSEGVREHLRLIKTAFGKNLKYPVYQNVKPHSRQVNLPERSFMRSALAEMEPEIRAQFNDAIMEGIKA